MLFLLISILLVALAVGLSWFNKEERPLRANWLPIVLFVGQVFFLIWLINFQRTIGCPTRFGDCYVEHSDLDVLQFSKMVFALGSWGYWLYLGFVNVFRLIRTGNAGLKRIHNAQQ